MLQVMTHFEEAVYLLNAEMLVIPGVLSVLVGLWLWLGGSLAKRTAVGCIGALVGAVAGFTVVREQAVLISSIGCGVLGLVFWRLCAALMAGLFVVVLVFVAITVLQAPALDRSESTTEMGDYDTTDYQSESLEARWAAVVRSVGDHVFSLPNALGLPLALVFGVTVFLAWLWPRLGLAACCAQGGTLLIWTGMVLLLIFKGVMPLYWICLRPVFFLAGYGLMVAFGTVEEALIYTNRRYDDERDEDRRYKKNRRRKKNTRNRSTQ
jgi:phosphate/sulfate permease